MKPSNLSFTTAVGTLALSVVSTACVISGDDAGIDDSATDSGNPPTTGNPSDGSGTDDSSDDGGQVCEGSDNLVGDPGFEMGTPNGAWEEASELFETPICDASCTTEDGAGPYDGDWYVWFGGVDDEPESASVEQSVTIPVGSMAELSFWVQIRSGAGTGDDVFAVELTDEAAEITDTIFMITDLDMPEYAGAYTRVDLDVADWADGGTFTLRFTSSISGNGLTSFFLDDVRLVSCGEGGTGTGTDTGVVDGGSSSGSDSGSGSSGSGDSGSSGSSGSGGSSSSSA